jgi:hypothetical protein
VRWATPTTDSPGPVGPATRSNSWLSGIVPSWRAPTAGDLAATARRGKRIRRLDKDAFSFQKGPSSD